MKRAALLTAMMLAACGDSGSTPDGSTDGPNGSGAAFAGIDPSPPDPTLQWIVVGLSTIVVAGSVRARRRGAKRPML